MAGRRTSWLDRGLAALALATGAAHLLLEAAYHLRFGQFLPFLWMHLLGAGLLLVAGAAAFAGRSARPWLSAAFGYGFALYGVTFFQAAQVGLEAGHAPALAAVLRASGAGLLVSGVAFATALVATRPRRCREGRP